EQAPAAKAAPAKVAAPKPAAAGGKPKSTAEILAAARAEKAAAAAGDSAPVAEAPASPKPAATKPAAAKPAAGGAKPKSTAEILAALRAEKAGGGAAAAPATAAEAKPVAAKAAAVAKAPAEAAPAAGLSLEEMLSKVRPAAQTAAPSTVAVAAPPKAAPPMPAKPTKPTAGKKGTSVEDRRGVLAMLASPFVFGWTALTGILGAWGLGLARFMLPNVLTEPPSKFKIGPPADYDLGTVSTKWVAQFGIWIVHTDQYQGKNLIYALASVCTHLGCTPSWLEGERKFKCPCHGSGFYITGVNFEGPAPRPLERVGLRLSEDGMLEVDKSLKFQEEMGQWNDATSFFEVTA
ncbi:MAG: ubiquinol-cytochrome c reductase iron-sulfur subunit, partial [Planctomycetaceae bacterium]